MTRNQLKAQKLHNEFLDKEGISEEFLYNAICYFEAEPEKVVEILLALSAENRAKLSKAFSDARQSVKEILASTLESENFSEIFHDPEIEDIVFYQFAHGYHVC